MEAGGWYNKLAMLTCQMLENAMEIEMIAEGIIGNHVVRYYANVALYKGH